MDPCNKFSNSMKGIPFKQTPYSEFYLDKIDNIWNSHKQWMEPILKVLDTLLVLSYPITFACTYISTGSVFSGVLYSAIIGVTIYVKIPFVAACILSGIAVKQVSKDKEKVVQIKQQLEELQRNPSTIMEEKVKILGELEECYKKSPSLIFQFIHAELSNVDEESSVSKLAAMNEIITKYIDIVEHKAQCPVDSAGRFVDHYSPFSKDKKSLFANYYKVWESNVA